MNCTSEHRFRDRLRVLDTTAGRALLVMGLLLAGLLPTIRDGHLLADITAYNQAATRLLAGEPIYASYPGDLVPYKYAPWFAALWVPLTFIPGGLLGALWLCLQLACAAWLLWRAPWWLALLTGPFVAWGAAIGNLAPLLFTFLAVAIGGRWIAVAIGVAASLKAFPILLIVPLLAQRRWGDAAASVVVTALLVAPIFLFDLRGYQVSAEGPHSVYNVFGPAVWAVSALAALLLGLLRPSWRNAGLAVMLANPRFQWYDLGYLLIGRSRTSAERR